jgi:hypothetical protein
MARTGTNSQKKAAAPVKGRKRIGVDPAPKRTSPCIGKLLNHEKGEEKEDLGPPVVILPVANPPVVLELSPEFENEARHDLHAQLMPITEENENRNIASDNESAPSMPTNETTDVVATTIDEVSQMLVNINGNAMSNEEPMAPTEDFEGVFPPSFELAAQTTAGVPESVTDSYIPTVGYNDMAHTNVEETIRLGNFPTETDMDYTSNATNLPARCLIDVGPVETGDVLENWKLIHGDHLTRTRNFFLSQERNSLQDWFTVEFPSTKVYPDFGPVHFAIAIQAEIGLWKWLTTPSACLNVRLYFPGINKEVLHPFVASVDPSHPIVNDSEDIFRFEALRIFPFCECAYLLRDQEPSKPSINNHLDTLFSCQVPRNNKGNFPKMQFRKTMNMPDAKHRVFFVYSSNAGPDTDTSNRSLYIRNMQKVKDFLIISTRDDPGMQLTHLQKQNF